MKSQEKLRESYERQLVTFNNNKKIKDANIEHQKEEIRKKISTLQLQLSKLEAAQKKNNERPFRTFEEFQQAALAQHQKAEEEAN